MKLWLPAASSNAHEVDQLILALVLISAAVLVLVFGLMLRYMFKYRAGSQAPRGEQVQKTWRVETAWTAATLLGFFGLFIWGADLYVRLFQPPANALRVYVVAKQWMWKVEHDGGQREINALHVPVNVPIQLIMTSEDVIHDFSVPAFRIKHDVLPGRYEVLWFRAIRPGHYHLFCTQLCGLDHANMIGQIVVLSADAYQQWLEHSAASTTLATSGALLLVRYGCSGCHGRLGPAIDDAADDAGASTVRAPSLNDLYGAPVSLADGRVVRADARYLRDAIMAPDTQRVAGYAPLMPSFAGVLSEEELVQIIAYLQSASRVPANPASP